MTHIFRDKLKTPGYLSQFDVARIRKITKEATEKEFQEYMSCSIENAKKILSFWEIAQVELWDAEILKRFFHVWIYEDREMVSARIQAAMHAGRLPIHVPPMEGLKWLESENVLIGMMGAWIKANAKQRKALTQIEPLTATGPYSKGAETHLPGWTVNKPVRFQGYTRPLYGVLRDAHTNGQPRPTAREVIEIFRANPPAEVARVLPADGIDYYTKNFSTKNANLKAIGEAITRMTTEMPR